MKVIGVERYNFADRQNPERMISGVNVYCVEPIDEERGEGFRYNKKGLNVITLNEWSIDHILHGALPAVGDNVIPAYNREGKLQALVYQPAK